MARSIQYSSIGLFSTGATAIGGFCETTLGIATSGCVFFRDERNGSGVTGMRTVSFFGPEGGGIGEGRTEADNGREAAGGFGGGKKFVEEIFSGADCEGEGTG